MRWVFGTLAAIVIVVAAAGIYFPVPRRYQLTIHGTVVDENGKPLRDAVIGSQIERRCGSVGGGSTSNPFARFRATTDASGRFNLSVHGLYFGYVSMLTLSGCTTVEDRFACKLGYNPVLEFNYMHPETMPLTGTYEANYTLRRGPPVRATGISFMSLAADALRCQAESGAPLRPMPRDSVWTDCPQKAEALTKTLSGWETGTEFKTRYYCTPEFIPRVEFSASPAVGFVKLEIVSTPNNTASNAELKWIPGATYVEADSKADPSIRGFRSVELFAVAESGGILRPVGGVRWSYDNNANGSMASALEPARPGDWGNMFYNAKSQLPISIAKRLSESVRPQ